MMAMGGQFTQTLLRGAIASRQLLSPFEVGARLVMVGIEPHCLRELASRLWNSPLGGERYPEQIVPLGAARRPGKSGSGLLLGGGELPSGKHQLDQLKSGPDGARIEIDRPL